MLGKSFPSRSVNVGVFRDDDCFHYYASRQRGVDVGPCQSCALAYAEDQRALEKQSVSTSAHRDEEATIRFVRHNWIGRKHLKVGDDVLIDIPGAAVNQNIKFTFDVAFHEPGICEEQPLLDVLRTSLNRVRQIVSIFA